ncbi:hypothetical protein TRICHSKD4_6150 [Roseibium sp. TrichSKD4]|nr:hypothetical protein TRICHSKD4_6150 [Roseibium sp. TrichSKD4]
MFVQGRSCPSAVGLLLMPVRMSPRFAQSCGLDYFPGLAAFLAENK